MLRRQVVVLELEVQVVHWLPYWLVLLEVQVGEVGVGECLDDGDALLGVEGEELLEEVDGVGVGEGEDLAEVLAVLLVLGEVPDELLALLGDVLHVLQVRDPQVLADQLDLVLGVRPRQERLPLQHLRENAPHAPHVH